MSSYVSDADKVTLNAEFYNLHDTFARPIVIFQTATQTVVYTNPETNILFQNAPFNSTTTTTVQSGVFQARILYGKKEPLEPFKSPGEDQNMIKLSEGEVRVRVDATGAALLSSAERVTFDGTIFDVESTQRPHGLFGPPNFFDFYLRKLQ